MIAAEACAAPLEDHLLVAHCPSGVIHLLNPTASLVWGCVDDGVDPAGIARELAAAFSIPVQQADVDVERILREWREFGLVRSDVAQPGPRAAPTQPDGAMPTNTTLVATRHYSLGGQRLSIQFLAAADITPAGRAHIERVITLFSGFSADTTAYPHATFSYVTGADAGWIAHRNQCLCVETISESFVELGSALLRHVYGPCDWLCRIHAATMALDGFALALPAPTGHGKSTLAAYLAAQGWSYFGDDTTAIDPGLRALPLPTAISLKAGSLPVLQSRYRDLAGLPEHAYGDKITRYLVLERRCAANAPLPLAALIFPAYVPASGAAAGVALEPLTAPQSAAALMQAGLSLGSTLSADKLAWLAALTERIPAWRLAYSSLPAAEATLRSFAARSCGA